MVKSKHMDWAPCFCPVLDSAAYHLYFVVLLVKHLSIAYSKYLPCQGALLLHNHDTFCSFSVFFLQKYFNFIVCLRSSTRHQFLTSISDDESYIHSDWLSHGVYYKSFDRSSEMVEKMETEWKKERWKYCNSEIILGMQAMERFTNLN